MTTSAPDSNYTEVGQNYRKFLDWREKIVGGYVAVIAGLGLGYSRADAGLGFQAILLFSAILTSLAFWILNIRNSKFIATCVRAGQKLEGGKGVYSEMGTLTHTSRFTHGLAVNLLVSGVIAGGLFGLWNMKDVWFHVKYLWPALVCLLIFVVSILTAEIMGDPDRKASTRRGIDL
jgi:hypothetical protein